VLFNTLRMASNGAWESTSILSPTGPMLKRGRAMIERIMGLGPCWFHTLSLTSMGAEDSAPAGVWGNQTSALSKTC
jgi:hypothetical protein